jgi:hypothetical protein
MTTRAFSFFRDLRGGGGTIRGGQMADALGGRVNPESGYEDDVCIYVLGSHRRDAGPEVPYAYYDVMDCGLARLGRIEHRTKGGLIAVSQTQADELTRRNPGRAVYLLPQHHCNFAREARTRTDIKVVGCIGGDSAVQWPHDAVARHLAAIGMEWKFEPHYAKRSVVLEFYRTIDVQISFRPTHPRYPNLLHMNPLKLSNAGSFGIPTVAYPEPAYVAEWRDDCLWGGSIPDIVRTIRRFQTEPGLYAEMAGRARVRAEAYHIDRIAGLYRQLPGVTA